MLKPSRHDVCLKLKLEKLEISNVVRVKLKNIVNKRRYKVKTCVDAVQERSIDPEKIQLLESSEIKRSSGGTLRPERRGWEWRKNGRREKRSFADCGEHEPKRSGTAP
ncbi:hypothetical protein K0M31_013698 [Melipona bicolor]|uniref:Uncharacterized protein n=1 Tax=Melipona bicolor TaxID=60889 RepID=A0AA40FHY3_9HYME|nr:hypothetical protein K0M31_013698 [Melipona bicolor]